MMNENKPTLEMLFQYWNMATSEQCYDAISLLSGKARLAKEKAEEVYGMSIQNLLALILRDFFRILLLDIVRENNIISL